MALNFSHRPTFPAHLAEDNLVSPLRIANGCLWEGIPERSREGCSRQWPPSMEVQDSFNYEEEMDWESVLPADPFGMDISSTVTAITGLLEYLEADYGGYGKTEVGLGKGDSTFLAELNFFFNKAMDFHQFPGSSRLDEKMSTAMRVDGCFQGEELGNLLHDGGGGSASSTESVNFDGANSSTDRNEDPHKITALTADEDDGGPHPALIFALGYLGVRDLLFVERVCKALRLTVQNDPLLWRSIHIDSPLNDRITDDILLQLTNRAQGNLHCLSLVECQRITDDGLKRILESNMRLTKLSVPGCTRLSIDGIISCLRAFKMEATTGIKCLRIGGLYGVTEDHFEELISLLGVHNQVQANYHKPPFYYRGNFYLSSEDGRPIDIEMCPMCHHFRLVYDCPAESCQGKDHATMCRACRICIPRCAQCGKCINDGEYEETFCLQLLCLNCWDRLFKCQEKHDIRRIPIKNTDCQEPLFQFHG